MFQSLLSKTNSIISGQVLTEPSTDIFTSNIRMMGKLLNIYRNCKNEKNDELISFYFMNIIGIVFTTPK